MSKFPLKAAADLTDKGQLKISVTSSITPDPITGATISISFTGDPTSTVEKVNTDNSGQTEFIELAAPAVEFSLEPSQPVQPYSEYNLTVSAPGYDSIVISGTQILPGINHCKILH